MWNVEFNTFNDFLCIAAHNLDHFGPISMTYSNSPNVLKQVQLDS